MTDTPRLAEYRRQLEDALATLEAGEDAGAEDRRTVELDQQSVGRLSRMDALQRQAMATAQSRRRGIERQRIRGALDRIEAGEFGCCEDCGEEIAPKRLDLDPTVPKCVSCASGA